MTRRTNDQTRGYYRFKTRTKYCRTAAMCTEALFFRVVLRVGGGDGRRLSGRGRGLFSGSLPRLRGRFASLEVETRQKRDRTMRRTKKETRDSINANGNGNEKKAPGDAVSPIKKKVG